MTRTWFITGCSSGFGYALARRALAAGDNVIATSRNPSKVPEFVQEIMSSPYGTWMSLDVTSPQTTFDAVMAEANERFEGGIDVVVNNAGYSLLGAWEDFPEEEARKQFETNYWGPCKILKAMVPHLRRRRKGTIVNLSSIAGVRVTPSRTLYSSSKYALEALSEGLAVELALFVIRTLFVEPGAFVTSFLVPGNGAFIEVSEAYVGNPVEAGLEKLKSVNGKQGGDVEKGVARIYDVVAGEGMGEGKQGLLRLPIGMDCYDQAMAQMNKIMKNFEEMKDIAASTNIAS